MEQGLKDEIKRYIQKNRDNLSAAKDLMKDG